MIDKELEDVILKKMGEYLSIYDSAYVHKQSFDYFINHRLSKIIEEEPIIVVPLSENRAYNIHFGQIFVDRPYIIDENRQIRYIYPNEARLRDLTYSSLVSVNIRTFITEKNLHNETFESEVQDFNKINLARIPMMIGSSKCNLFGKTKEQRIAAGECAYDNGGYFIIKGKERVLVSQERINYNIVHVFDQKSSSKFLMVSEIRSMSDETGHSVLIQMKLNNNLEKKVFLQIPYVSQEIPLGYIFKAYNFTMEEIIYILDFSLKSEYSQYPMIELIVRNIIRDAETIHSQEKAITYISQFSMHNLSKERKFYYIHQILNNELFPHLGITSTRNQKGFFLGHMLAKLLFTFVKKRSMDDRDHINNKRLEAAGHLVAELFRTLFKRFVRSMEPQLAKRPDILVVMSRNNIISQGIKHCFSTGNWGIPKSNYIRTGVSQIMSRLTYNSFLSHLRRILIPIGKEGKNTKIRQVHPSQIGYICPFETPEGHCLTADTRILSEDGITECPIRHFKNPQNETITINTDNGTESKSKTFNYFEIIPTELFQLTLINGQTIKASGLHPFLVFTEDGELEWKKCRNIQMSDILATRPVLRSVDSVPANGAVRFLGMIRATYQQDHQATMIPDCLDIEIVQQEIGKFFNLAELTERTIQIKDITKIFDWSQIIPTWITKKGHIRDFLMGFFCGLGIHLNVFIEHNLHFDLDSINLEGDYHHKIAAWKHLFKLCAENFDIQWGMNTFEEEQTFQFSPIISTKSTIQYVETFGFYFNHEIEKEMFIYKDFLKLSDKSISMMDFMKNIRIHHQKMIFYPLKTIQKLAVEMTMDFTTVSDNHNFVANGFVTHNSAGIVKNMTLTTQLSTKINSVFVRMVLEEMEEIKMNFDFVESNNQFIGKEFYKVLLDGNWIGSCLSDIVYKKIQDYKKSGRFSTFLSISINHNEREILIFSDEGRMIRPLFNAKNFPTLEDLKTKSIENLFKENKMIMIDSYEMENNIVAMTADELQSKTFYTLCEIHSSLIIGLCVGLIPYSDHTQAPRITYHASMGKQAIGLYASTNNIRADTIVHILHYPEKPLIKTHMSEISGCDEMVFGMNLIVAVAMYTGFNQEDSVILNQSAIDRGLFRSFAFRTIHVEERKKSTTHTEDILLPPLGIRTKSFNYSKLDLQGIVKCGIFVGPSDVIVGRVQTKNIKTGGEEKMDTSVVIKSGEEGYVDRVFISTSPEGYKMVKVKIRGIKIPEIGDKVASRSAQKGTVGMVLRQEDMPFCAATGMVPDIIINPLCLPSRMTINQIIETIASKSSAHEGVYRYGTPFTRHSTDVVESLCDTLEENGFSADGKEIMCNGFTGQAFQARIFMGPTYYHRLKHLVSAKIHARNHGSLQALTRQPVEGRSRDGGLRFGEMERDTLTGTSQISLKCGLSIQLVTMVDSDWDVLGWDPILKGVKPSRKIAFLNKGMKDCVEITLQDGRKVVCTPDHPMLTSDLEWIRAKDLITGVSRLKVGLHYPYADLDSELQECAGWSFDPTGLDLKTETMKDYLRSMAFMRILGWLITDGGLYIENVLTAKFSLGHKMDVQSFLDDMRYFCDDEYCVVDPSKFLKTSRDQRTGKQWTYYCIRFPIYFAELISNIRGIIIGKKIIQEACLPTFVLDENFPRPLLREFLGGMFGGDGHTCILSMHRGKRDVMTSVSFSKSRTTPFLPSLIQMMEDLKRLLGRCGIHNVTIQALKETSHSKAKTIDTNDKCYQSTLHLDMTELLPFWEKIGFRHCAHKSLRLEAGASYKRLREGVIRQHNWLVQRVDDITNFSEIKRQNPTKIVGTKKAIEQAVKELKERETLLHEYAIPSTHDITDHLIKGTSFGKFTSKSFPTAEDFIKNVHAFDWFVEDEDSKNIRGHTCYAVKSESNVLPTMDMTVLGVRPCGKEAVYDIEVEKTNSFLANGVVAHNCMISHGVSRFLTERLFDMSDVFSVPVCSDCGTMPHTLEICNVCDSTNVRKVFIPYACKLLFQELMAMGIKINLLPDEDRKNQKQLV